MKKNPNQLELPLVPQARPRMRLSEDDLVIGAFTKWESRGHPPCDGWWEVCKLRDLQEKVDPPVERWWFKQSTGPLIWLPEGPNVVHRTSDMVMHDEFIDQNYAWRGMAEPEAGIYPCPPYSTEDLMKRAQEAGVKLKTMYATISKPASRTRVKL